MSDEALNPEAQKTKEQAEKFVGENKKRIAEKLTSKTKYAPEEFPLSVFMAGSPGAGKTEFSKELVKILEEGKTRRVIRIDGDELRSFLPGYTGANSYLFQGAVSMVTDRIHDLVLKNKQTFLLDGTFSRYDKATENINRSLNKGRGVAIFYLYQKPEVAWKFTQAREKVENRHIPKDVFIEHFLKSREVITKVRDKFDDRVAICLVKKNFESHKVEKIVQIMNPQMIDQYLEQSYTKDDLEKLL